MDLLGVSLVAGAPSPDDESERQFMSSRNVAFESISFVFSTNVRLLTLKRVLRLVLIEEEEMQVTITPSSKSGPSTDWDRDETHFRLSARL